MFLALNYLGQIPPVRVPIEVMRDVRKIDISAAADSLCATVHRRLLLAGFTLFQCIAASASHIVFDRPGTRNVVAPAVVRYYRARDGREAKLRVREVRVTR